MSFSARDAVVGDENEGEILKMRKNNNIIKERHILRNHEDDDVILYLFCLKNRLEVVVNL